MATVSQRFPPTPSCLAMHIAAVVLAILMWMTLAARFIAYRRRSALLGLDECLLVCAGLGVTASTTIYGFLIRTGLGYHIYDHRWDEVRTATTVLQGKLHFAFELLYTVNTGFVKVSALLFIIRVFPTQSVRRASYISIIGIGILSGAFLLTSLLLCRPISANWAAELQENMKCIDRKPAVIVSCATAIATDFLVLGLPIWPIWNLQVKNNVKTRLIFLFVSGIIVTVFSIARLHFIIHSDYAFDFVGTSALAAFLGVFEPELMIVCVSLPMIYSLVPKQNSEWDSGRSSHHGLGNLFRKMRFGGNKNKANFVAIEEPRPPTYLSKIMGWKGPEKESGRMLREAIMVEEAFCVCEEPANFGVLVFGGVDLELSNPHSAVAWSERRK
ncbi:hypothetical protein GGR51DRAFT_560629 [Nemania sp. FL0031]|nr:hypothetical protein GGR51DRAFT_560629 [Nemania sp. FL0031]